jgi:hypothetical protein
MYKVTVSQSIHPKNVLMTCEVTDEIPLKNVIFQLQKLGVDVKDTRTKSDPDYCENSSSATLDVSLDEKLDINIQILCIDSLKTMCDKLYQLSEGVEYINTVDDMVPFDSCINYYGGEKESCPTVARSFANGFYVTGGTRTTNSYSDIFYRNFVLLCFFCNSGYSNDTRLSSLVSNVLGQQPELLPQIKSSRLINYIARLNILQRELCLNEERNLQLDDPYDQWMIQIICCELEYKNKKIGNYIDNVSNILEKYNNGNGNFDEFYRSIIGLEDLEKLLTMSSFSFYSSNEDSIFKPDRINIPEKNCKEYGIEGRWTNEDNNKIEIDSKSDRVSQIDINKMFSNIQNVEYDKDNTVIIFDENTKNLKDKLKIMIDENDIENNRNNIGTRKIKGDYGDKNVTTFTTPTTLELLFTLLKNVKSSSIKKPRREKSRGQQVSSVIGEQSYKENIKQKIIDITTDFMNQIGIECDGLSVEYLETLLVSSRENAPRILEYGSHSKTNSPTETRPGQSEEPSLLNVPKRINVRSSNGVIRSYDSTGKLFHRKKNTREKEDEDRVNKEETAMMIDEDSVNEEETAMMIDENRITNDMKKISNKGKQTRKKKGGRKPKFTRRKNKKSPKRKTIKKRKMPKRKNKTRRQRK